MVTPTAPAAWAFKFTIPMRGNEGASNRSPAMMIRSTFTIPMRGNERELCKAGRIKGATKFTIPMRGNEQSVVW